MPQLPRTYTHLAPWFHLLTAPADYPEEAATYRRVMREATAVQAVPELGSGGGNNGSMRCSSTTLSRTSRRSKTCELWLRPPASFAAKAVSPSSPLIWWRSGAFRPW